MKHAFKKTLAMLLVLVIGVGPYTLGSFVPSFGFSIVYLIAGALALVGMGLYYIMIGRFGRFTRHQMDRTAEAKQIVAQRDQDKAVLLVSLELDEVMNLSDRILVMYEGEIVGEFDPKTVSVEELGLYMAGAKRQEKYSRRVEA